MSNDNRRWYDHDPTLREALELLSMSSDDTKDQAAEFIGKLQEQVAADIIEKVYLTVTRYQGTGNRWYDNDPIMLKAIELLRAAPPHMQKIAAKKLLKALSQNDFDQLEADFNKRVEE